VGEVEGETLIVSNTDEVGTKNYQMRWVPRTTMKGRGS
jgi:hypothetical protein